MSLLHADMSKLAYREKPVAFPVVKSITLDAKAISLTDNYLTFNYGEQRVRYRITHRDYNAERTEVTLYLSLHRIINEGDPE